MTNLNPHRLPDGETRTQHPASQNEACQICGQPAGPGNQETCDQCEDEFVRDEIRMEKEHWAALGLE